LATSTATLATPTTGPLASASTKTSIRDRLISGQSQALGGKPPGVFRFSRSGGEHRRCAVQQGNHPMCAVAARMLPRLLARIFLICAIAALNLDVAFAGNDVRTYRCTAKEGVSISEDGTLDKMVGSIAQKHFDKVVIEIPSGHVTFPSEGTKAEWVVQRTTAEENEFVLYPKASRRLGHTVANAATHFIRLRAATNEKQPTFMAVMLSYIATGTCEIVK
jgi:hypothetical protein